MLSKGWKSVGVRHGLTIALVALLGLVPAIGHGVFDGYDLPSFHLRWAKQFSDQVWAGDVYPRWLGNLNAGFGSPTFYFYAPIPFFITSLLRPLILGSDPYGWHQLLLGAYVALAGSGIAAYLWLRQLTSPIAALIAAALYMVIPYHLAIDLYWRFAYAEFWSFVWFPLILLFCHRLIHASRSSQSFNLMGIAIAQALLIMTHLPSFLMFFPIPIVYLLGMTTPRKRWKTLAQLGLAVMGAIGLSAIYWLPAMTTQDFISMKSALEENVFFSYQKNFLFMDTVHEDFAIYRRYTEMTTLLTLALAISAFLTAITQTIVTALKQTFFWMGVAIAATLMTLPITKGFWDLLPPLQKVQFPWRFNTVLTIATIALVALAIDAVQEVRLSGLRRNWYTAGLIIGTGGMMSAIALIPAQGKLLVPFNQAVWLWMSLTIAIAILLSVIRGWVHIPRRITLTRSFTVGVLLTMTLLFSSGIIIKKRLYPPYQLNAELAISRDAKEYRPQWVPENLYEQGPLRSMRREFNRTQALIRSGTITLLQRQPNRIVFETKSDVETKITMQQFYYPSWSAIDRTDAPFTLMTQPNDRGLLTVDIPKGNRKITIERSLMPVEKQGMIITSLTSMLMLGLFLWKRF